MERADDLYAAFVADNSENKRKRVQRTVQSFTLEQSFEKIDTNYKRE